MSRAKDKPTSWYVWKGHNKIFITNVKAKKGHTYFYRYMITSLTFWPTEKHQTKQPLKTMAEDKEGRCTYRSKPGLKDSRDSIKEDRTHTCAKLYNISHPFRSHSFECPQRYNLVEQRRFFTSWVIYQNLSWMINLPWSKAMGKDSKSVSFWWLMIKIL